MLEEGTKRTNGKRAPARTGGGACFGTGARPAGRSHAAVHALTCRLPRAAVHTVMRCGSCARAPLDMRPRCGSGDRAALAFAIVRCGSCWRKERNGQTGNAPPPVRAGARALGRGHARPDGHMPRFMRLRAACHEPQFIRSCAVVHAPARRLTCGRAAAPAIVRRLPLRLCAAAHAGGRNETDKRETRPRPYGRGRVLWDGGTPGRTVTCRGSCAYVPLATSRSSYGHALWFMRPRAA